MTATNTVSTTFESFTMTDIESTPVINPVNVYVPPLPKPVLEAGKPMQTHEVTVIGGVSVIPMLKTLATLGALWLLGSALIALATLFVHIVVPIIIGLVLAYVLAKALEGSRTSKLIEQIRQMFSQENQPVQPTPAKKKTETVFVRTEGFVIGE